MPSRLLLVLAGTALVAVGMVVWCAREPALVVDTVEARRGAIAVEVTTNGEIEPVAELEVRAGFAGRVLEIQTAAARVEPGDTLVRLDDTSLASELAAAEAERLAAQESLRSAGVALERANARAETDRELLAQGAITPEVYRESEATASETRARLASLGKEVPLRVSALDRRIEELRDLRAAALVRAPFAGVVYKTGAKAGAFARAGESLVWLADLDHLRIRVNIDQVDLGRVGAGQVVRIACNAYPGRSWSGRISEVVPNVVVKESRAVSEGLATIDPPADGLVPGMTVDVEIVVESARDVLQVPAQAVFVSGGKPVVYRIDSGHARRTPVVLGRTGNTGVEIVEGLALSDRLVLGPAAGLRDGVRVSVRRGDAPTS